VHGNSRSSPKETILYRLEDKDTGETLKHGVTSDPARRYPKEYMKDKEMVPLDKGSRADMLDKERDLVKEIWAPLNRESWAKKKPTDG
jgi:hypothetical protein